MASKMVGKTYSLNAKSIAALETAKVATVKSETARTFESGAWKMTLTPDGAVVITGTLGKPHFSKSAIAKYLKTGEAPSTKNLAAVKFGEGLQVVQIIAYEHLVGDWKKELDAAANAVKGDKSKLGGFVS